MAGFIFVFSGEKMLSDMVQWLWPKLVQQELNQLQENFNNHRVHKDSAKKLPSGVSPNVAFALHTEYQAENCLQVVECKVVKQLMENIGGKVFIRFVSVEYENCAETVFANLGFKELSFHNVVEDIHFIANEPFCCSRNFPAMDGQECGKYSKLQEATEAECAAVYDKPQYAHCRIYYDFLQSTLYELCKTRQPGAVLFEPPSEFSMIHTHASLAGAENATRSIANTIMDCSSGFAVLQKSTERFLL
ncbi:uncharacterized protein EDB93DRAFT_1102810 [Suillus bovinus]|uniref:uncharacterized protein n=1 Tax=Suillus bovinus TaxID=48563 RepID=UPI001B861A86|nr:uncharacterized protein EDB93DRAFT_1102810 [Suillus bovinus]KAG2153062.1 hypothetical protein EDB93DRAFT_1102810 [Suillus bovinus]